MGAILRGLSAGAFSNLLGRNGVEIVGAIILGALAAALIMREVGRLTSTNRLDGDGGMILRGGFLLIVYGAGALIFFAATVWAWRSLFG